MVDPDYTSPTKRPIFFIDLSGQNSNPIIPDSFIVNHSNGKIQSTKLKLTSDASDRTWEVELDGQRLAGGWKNFSENHNVRNNDVLGFRHDGDMVFHVIPVGRRFAPILDIPSTSDDEDDDEQNIFDDDDDEVADVGEDDDDYLLSEEELYPSSKKRVRVETESPSENSYLVTHITPSSLSRNYLSILNKFARANGLNNRHCEVDIMDVNGKRVTMGLRHNKSTGQAFIQGPWRNFCSDNGIKAGTYCRFNLVENGRKPVLQLCYNTSSSTPVTNEKRIVSEGRSDETEVEDCSETALMNRDRIPTFEFKIYMMRSSQIRLPAYFTRANGIEEAGEITLVNKDGVVWKLHLVNIKGRGQFYIRGCKEFFIANGMTRLGDSFTLEAIQGGRNPILKFCPKAKEASLDGFKTPETRLRRTVQGFQVPRAEEEEERETQVEKRARVSEQGGASSVRTRASNKAIADQENLQRKEPTQPCSISEQVTKVKQCVVDTLTCVQQFQSELRIKEQSLKDSLLEIGALEEKITEISKFFNINQV